MTIAFTICSINYLAQAKTLGESLLEFNPDYKYVIGLLDKTQGYEKLLDSIPYQMLEVEKIGIENFEEMYNNYEITELNTSVKPFYIDYFLKTYPEVTSVIYLDPDIIVFDAFTELESLLKENTIVITPHFFTPVFDGYGLSEMDILNAGLYNLGFIAVSNNGEARRFVDWWKVRLRKHCRIAFSEGMFVDQLWINFVPLYFEKVFILRHLGYNMAYWNLHERNLSVSDGKYFVNGTFPLVFYHYSGYSLLKPYKLSKYQNRFSLAARKDVREIFKTYEKRLIENRHHEFSEIECFYFEIYKERKQKEWGATKEGRKALRTVWKRKNLKILTSIKGMFRNLF